MMKLLPIGVVQLQVKTLIVCVANNYYMEEGWIGYLFYFLLVECMDIFL